jgi:hypothetical protein
MTKGQTDLVHAVVASRAPLCDYLDPMDSVRSVLYLDFDNVLGGLLKLDPNSAIRYAEQPQLWLSRLAAGGRDERRRRWLVLRCYMNPAGWVSHPANDGTRLYFSKFRPYLTDAGFEVIDCPRLTQTKNGADIRLVIDAVEALRADVHYDEFVIASGDSDMTPLIVRLRASDRRVTLLSPSDSAVVLGAVADRLIGGEEFLELLDTEAIAMDGALGGDFAGALERAEGTSIPIIAGGSDTEVEAKQRFETLVATRYAQATEPMNLAALAHELRNQLGPVTTDTSWFGYGGFGRALQALQLPSVRMSQHYIWDSSRHAEPTVQAGPPPPDPVLQVTRVLRLPQLPRESWPSIHHSLAAFVAAYEFNLTEATRWCRDRLTESGERVNRQAIGVVARGAAYGGCPLFRQPPPVATAIATAFVENVLSRVAAADVDLSPDEVDVVRAWFGAV